MQIHSTSPLSAASGFNSSTRLADTVCAALAEIAPCRVYGRVNTLLGMLVEIGGVEERLSVGGRCVVQARDGRQIPCEIVGFRDGKALAMPFGDLAGVGLGCEANLVPATPSVRPNAQWLGRVINALGEPIDGKGPLPTGDRVIPIRNAPPPAHARQRMGGRLDLGVRAINTFLPICRGQRMGIFAGSGVGKSVMMSMLARYADADADVNVIGLVGERGREVQEFIEDILGEEGLRRSVVVVATSDESPLLRRQAAYMTMAIAESFRHDQREVLVMIDSVTRFAMAQREIGLSAGEPPTSKGYPPTTFSELARLLERAGPGVHGDGNITAIFSVLVEGDDHNEPVADAVRGIIDGHIVLERPIAERGRYPAINILKSVSRALPNCCSEDENIALRSARQLLSSYEDMAELIRLGAYRAGSDPQVDRAIRLYPALEAFLNQRKEERAGLMESFEDLVQILAQP